MQYQVDPTDQTPENGRKPLFWHFGSSKHAFFWLLNECSNMSDIMAKLLGSFSIIKICNTRLIRSTKLKKMAKNLFFGSLDHSKMPFCDFWMIHHDLVLLPKVKKHLVPSKYAISSRSNRPNTRKWPKTSILALWIIQKCILRVFEWPIMTW